MTQPGTPAAGRRICFDDRLLAEAVRAHEAARSGPMERGLADAETSLSQELAHARSTPGDEAILVERARRLPVAGDFRRSIDRARRAVAGASLIAIVLALVAGAAAARVALGEERGRPVNVFWLLGGVLGTQTLLLLGWVLLLAMGNRVLSAGSIGGVVLHLGQWLAGRSARGPAPIAAVEAIAAVAVRSSAGRWLLGLFSHGAWAAFNVACLVALLLLLGARQYSFSWESTYLSPGAYREITATIAQGPAAIGFAVPTREDIAAARLDPLAVESFPAQDVETRRRWASLLVGSVVVYGLLPRAALLVICALLFHVARRGYRLDADDPVHARALGRVRPSPREETPVAASDMDDVAGSDELPERAGPRPAGPPAVLGLELVRPETGWPPPLDGPAEGARDLGILLDRADRRRAFDELARDPEPVPLVVVADLTTTPDRGMEHLLRRIRNAVSRPPYLVLTGGERLRGRTAAGNVAVRVDDWHRMARRAGLPAERVETIDLNHLTDASRAKLRAWLGAAEERDEPSADRADLLPEAFDAIMAHARRWRGAPGPDEQAELHRAIARTFGAGDGRRRKALGVNLADVRTVDDLKDAATRGARHVRGLLPPSLAGQPKWLAAGAIAGAAGCLAVASLATPVVLGALPMWSIVGGAVGGLLPLSFRRDREADGGVAPGGTGDAVRAAALLATLLALQGRPETEITRVLSEVFDADDAERDLDSVEAIAAWLDAAGARFAASEAGRSAS